MFGSHSNLIFCSRDFDIANTHDDNHTLFQREDIKAFYKEIDEVTKLTEDSIAWLGSIPHTMSNTAIPLFRENQSGTDYQVHPYYSKLKRSMRSSYPFTIPHFYVSLMDLGSERIPVIPFGRLFINIPVYEPVDPNHTIRLSKWTGYEVLFGIDKRLWFVFNYRSLGNGWSGFYHVRCNLWEKSEERGEPADPNTPANRSDKPSPSASLYEMIKSPNFQSAYVSLTVSSLSSMTFAEVQGQIQRTMSQGGEALIGDIDEGLVDKKLQML